MSPAATVGWDGGGADDAAVQIRDERFDRGEAQVGVRVYAPSGRGRGLGLVWAHGGGFAWGDLDMPEAHWVSAQLAARGFHIVSVDYRRAPVPQSWTQPGGEPPRAGVHAPVPATDVQAAFEWAVRHIPGITTWALGGASAGGNLAASAALRMIGQRGVTPQLLVLAYPTLHAVPLPLPADLRAALDADAGAELRSPDTVADLYDNYLGGADPDVWSAPGQARADQLVGFPSTLIVNSEVDELRASGEAFARTLASAGVQVRCLTEPGTHHGHLNRPDEPAATATVERIAQALRSIGRIDASAREQLDSR